MKKILCRLGFHRWGRAVYETHALSNVLDYRQRCNRCGKTITWVQPKGLNIRFYPVYWGKRISWIVWLVIIIGVIYYLFQKNIIKLP